MKIIRQELTAAKITEIAKLKLFAQGFRVWRQVNTTVRRRKNIVEAGVPDIIGYHKTTGRFIGCEVKKIGDVFSMAQIDFMSKLIQSGGIAIYATEERGDVVLRDFSSHSKYKHNEPDTNTSTGN